MAHRARPLPSPPTLLPHTTAVREQVLAMAILDRRLHYPADEEIGALV